MYSDQDRKNDFLFFLNHYDELYKEYGRKYFVIRCNKILGVYDDNHEAIEQTRKSYPLGTFIVQYCNGDESGYTNYISSWEIVG